jgi:hypothetical protein
VKDVTCDGPEFGAEHDHFQKSTATKRTRSRLLFFSAIAFRCFAVLLSSRAAAAGFEIQFMNRVVMR